VRKYGLSAVSPAEVAGTSYEKEQWNQLSDDLTWTGRRKKHHTSPERETHYRDLIEHLISMKKEDAIATLRRVAAGEDVTSIMNHLRSADLKMQISLVPETIRQYDFTYVAQMPSQCFATDNLYIDSLLYQAIFDRSTSDSQLGIVRAKKTGGHATKVQRVEHNMFRPSTSEVNFQASYVSYRSDG
jgi:hypothetical protein